MAKGLSAAKAKKILTDGYVKGKPLTAKQRKYFGAIASGATPLKKINGAEVEKAQWGKILKAAKKFDSSIDWRKWVKYTDDFDNNPDVIKHLNEIEETTKGNGTWMKNSDGSAFKGTQEEFVIQQSDNFKNAFPNPIRDAKDNIQTNYHGSPNTFEAFDESRASGVILGKGIYTTPDTEVSNIFKKNNPNGVTYEMYINSNNPQNIVTSNDFVKHSEKLNNLKNRWRVAYRGSDSKQADGIYQEIKLLEEDWGRKYEDELKMRDLQDGFDYFEKGNMSIIPFSNNPKSMKGNILFDMTNPNIYKAIVPGAIGVGAASQMTGPVREDGQFKNGGWLDKYEDGGSVPKAQTGVSTPIELDEVILKSVRKSPEWKAYRDSLNYYNKGEKFIKEGGAYDYLRERYKDPLKKDKYEKAINQKLEDEITEYGKRDYDYYKKGSAKRNVIQRDEHYGGGYEDGLHLFQDVYSAEDWSEPVVPLSDKIQPIEVLWGPESGPRPIYKKPTKPMDSYSSQLDSDGIEPYTQGLESLISGNIEAQPIYQHKPYNQNDKPIPLGLLQKMGIENPESQGFLIIKMINQYL